MTIEINVALDGRHFFATHERSCTSPSDAIRVLETIRNKFPKSEGFEITVSYNPGISYMATVRNQSSSDLIENLIR